MERDSDQVALLDRRLLVQGSCATASARVEPRGQGGRQPGGQTGRHPNISYFVLSVWHDVVDVTA